MSRRREKQTGTRRPPPTRVELSSGGVVFRSHDGQIELLIIRDSHGNWALPKGRIEQGETAEQAARREIGEETGLTALALVGELATTDFWFEDKWEVKGERVHKFVSYFLYELTESQPVTTSLEEHVQAFAWVSPDEFGEQLTYASLKAVVEKTRALLASL